MRITLSLFNISVSFQQLVNINNSFPNKKGTFPPLFSVQCTLLTFLGPIEAPKLEVIDMYDFTKILLHWEPISKHGSRGEVLGYRIQYWLSEVQETPVIATVKYEGYIFAPNRTTTLTGLQPFSRYRIRIQAFTEGGYGVWSQEHNGGDVTFTVCYSQ